MQLQSSLKVLGQTVKFDLDLGRRCLLGKIKIELAAALLNLSPSPRERLCFDKNRAELIAATTFLKKEGKPPQPLSFGKSVAFSQLPAEIQFIRMHANTWCLAAEDLFPLALLITMPPLPSPPGCFGETTHFQSFLPASQFLTPGFASLLVLSLGLAT